MRIFKVKISQKGCFYPKKAFLSRETLKNKKLYILFPAKIYLQKQIKNKLITLLKKKMLVIIYLFLFKLVCANLLIIQVYSSLILQIFKLMTCIRSCEFYSKNLKFLHNTWIKLKNLLNFVEELKLNTINDIILFIIIFMPFFKIFSSFIIIWI